MTLAMPTRNVVLNDRQADLVDRLVKSGRYQNASEVLRDGLRMVEVQQAEDRARVQALRDAARTGIADLEAGRFRSFSDAGSLGQHLADIAKARTKASRAR